MEKSYSRFKEGMTMVPGGLTTWLQMHGESLTVSRTQDGMIASMRANELTRGKEQAIGSGNDAHAAVTDLLRGLPPSIRTIMARDLCTAAGPLVGLVETSQPKEAASFTCKGDTWTATRERSVVSGTNPETMLANMKPSQGMDLD